jgi:hypothetical protein
MSAIGYRSCLVVAAVFGGLLTVVGLLELSNIPPIIGVWGCTFGAGDKPFTVRVVSTERVGPARSAGVEAGDTIDVRDYDLGTRLAIFGQPIAGQPVHLSLERRGKPVQAVVVPARFDQRHTLTYRLYVASTRTYAAGLLLMCIFAGLIAWRRAERPHTRVLSLMLSTFAIGEMASPQNVVTPWPWLTAILLFAAYIAYVAPIPLFAAFASCIAAPRSRSRTMALNCTYALAGMALLIALAIAAGQAFLWVDPVGLFFQPAWTIPQNAAYLVALACGMMAVAAARGAERQLAGWVTASVIVLFISQIVATVGEEFATSYSGYVAYEIVGNVGVILAPIGLSYAVLNRRLLDIGFALNRAAVFAVVSMILVGVFVMVEWGVAEWIRVTDHLTGVLVNVLIALALGFSIRAIHNRVDRGVDLLFFRKRYEEERCIRDFAQEAPFITSASVLIERAVAVVEECAHAVKAAAVRADDPAVDPDDEVMLALRAFHKPVEIAKYHTALEGEYAFPMSTGGRLVGAFVCGPKRHGEAYAPDEFDAIEQLARAVGAALDALQTRSDGTLASLLGTQREILETLASIKAALIQRVG